MKKKIINTHFSLETRTIIENSLNEGKSITEISSILRRDRSNISREILKHRKSYFPSSFNNSNPCLKCNFCELKHFECYLNCKNLEINLCEKLTSSPHVCNGCKSKNFCRHVKYYYKALEANLEYLNNWISKRKKLHYKQEELDILNTDFKMLVLKNKSVYHSLLIINNRGFNFNIKSIYRQIKAGYLDITSADLPRCRKNVKRKEIDKSYKKCNIDGHTYEDYLLFIEKNPNVCEMQMDTVEGIKENNAPVMLTLQIVKIHFLFVFKIDNQTIDNVIKKIKLFKNIISDEIFNKIMKILLTDNGKEFKNIDLFKENFTDINIFYCHPYSSYEKPNIENNHELIRRVIPKGVSLKCYTQDDFDILCSHVNSLCRESLDGKCPFDLITQYIPVNILNKLNICKINPEDVTLTPELLGIKNINNIKKFLDKNDLKKANIRLK